MLGGFSLHKREWAAVDKGAREWRSLLVSEEMKGGDGGVRLLCDL